MYRLNESDLWHRRHDELLRDAENERLARHLRAPRPKLKQLGRAATFSLGLVALLALVVVLTTLMVVMTVATALPAPSGPAAITRWFRAASGRTRHAVSTADLEVAK